MPIHDLKCKKCGNEQPDTIINLKDGFPNCPICNEKMEVVYSGWSNSIKVVPSELSKFKHKYGNSIPPEYKSENGVRFYRP